LTKPRTEEATHVIERRFSPRSAARSVAPRRHSGSILVAGLGRFGGTLALELESLGFEVLGIDTSARRVQELSEQLTHVVEADTTDPVVLRQLGAADVQTAVVGIGTDLEASILTTSILAELSVPSIWAKAVTDAHGRILERVGAHHVVFPEHDMGQRVAHLVTGRVLDWFQLDEHFAIVETTVPADLVGKTLAEAGIRARYGVTVVAVKPAGQGFTYATADTKLAEGDLLVVAGEPRQAEAFST
jgi:trk system potassium uptake protein TrkA